MPISAFISIKAAPGMVCVIDSKMPQGVTCMGQALRSNSSDLNVPSGIQSGSSVPTIHWPL